MGSPTSNALVRGLVAGFASLTIYFLIVVFTTPNLAPMAAINATLKINWIIILGVAVAVGSQVYVSNYGKILGCRISKRKGIIGTSGSTAASSFFSFFSLIPLGCYGSWLLILSFLPALFGNTLSVVLIQYSKPLSYVGLFIAGGYSVFTAIRLRRELKNTKLVQIGRNIS